MKVCFTMYQGNMYSGGQGVYLYYLTRELARLGHEVHVIAGPPRPVLDERVHIHMQDSFSYWNVFVEGPQFFSRRAPHLFLHPVNFYEFASTRFTLSQHILMFSLRAYQTLQRLSREHHFDVVHDNQTLGYGMLLIRQAGWPVIATVHHPMTIDLANSVRLSANLYEAVRRLVWFPWVMQQFVARRMDKIITVSKAAYETVRQAFGLDPDKMRMIYIAVDTDFFRPLPDVERLPNTILYVANSEDRNKGARYFFEALALLKQKRDFHVIFVDRPRHQLKLAPRLIRHYGLDSRVTYTGRVTNEQLRLLYNQATFAVTSSLFEGFGLPPAQAMACGTPVIATTGGALPEVVEHGESGWLVPPSDAHALAEAIDLFFADPALRERLGRRGAESIRERFNWRRTAEETVEVYEEVIARRSGSWPRPTSTRP